MAHTHDLPDLSATDRRALLALARAAIETRLGLVALAKPEHTPAFDRPGGAFVTVFVKGELHGCVGLPEAREPLGQVVSYCAGAAAFGDPRFPPVTLPDLKDLSLEISVLTPAEAVVDPAVVEVGRHGLVVEQGAARGLLLPQVPVEHGWTREQFLDHTCIKAGLPPDAWRRGARVYSFEALVFAEAEGSRSSCNRGSGQQGPQR
jgi:AmmeMemoRadiSam system protein A